MALSVVVFPAPLAPSRVVIPPSRHVQRHALEDEDDAVVDDLDVVERQHGLTLRRPARGRPPAERPDTPRGDYFFAPLP